MCDIFGCNSFPVWGQYGLFPSPSIITIQHTILKKPYVSHQKTINYANQILNQHICAATLFRSAEGIGPPPRQISKSSDIPFLRKHVASKCMEVRKYRHTMLLTLQKHNTFTLRWRYKNIMKITSNFLSICCLIIVIVIT